MSLMGVDVGSTGVKAAVFNASGKLIASAYEEYPVLFTSAGWAELDSSRVVDAAFRVIAKSADEVRNSDPVETIGIASHGEAFTPVASDGRLMGSAMAFSDTRAEPEVGRWCGTFGADRLYRMTGHPPFTMYSLFKLIWTRDNLPDIWRSAWKFLFFGDLLAFKLTGETRTDYTLASRTSMFDVERKEWVSEILDIVDLDAGRLPEPVPSGTILGTVKPDVAGNLGLDSRVSVAVSGHDQSVGALGCGAAAPGVAAYSVGTAECICPLMDSFVLNYELMENNLATDPHVLPDCYTVLGFSLTGGNVFRWVRDKLALEEVRAAREAGEDPYDRIIAAASDKPARLVLIPHLGPTGTPHLDAAASGALLGLTFATERSEILRAFLEGITYDIKWNLAILTEVGFDLKELRVIGGGARSDTWMQIKADILGAPLTTMRVTEATCAGAALLAGNSAGIVDARSPGRDWATPMKTFLPRDEEEQAYDERFGIYREAYGSLAATRKMLNVLQ